MREIPFDGIAGARLEQLIEFCYTGRVQLNDENAQPILVYAQQYRLERLIESCAKYLKQHLRVENCCAVLIAAASLYRIDLSQAAIDFILDHFTAVIRSDAFKQLEIDTLISCLTDAGTMRVLEEDIFDAIRKWIRYDEVERIAEFKRLMSAMPMVQIKSSVSAGQFFSGEIRTLIAIAYLSARNVPF